MKTQPQRSADIRNRSLLELRRLAYRAKRSDAAREVLHDALLETFPYYSDVIRRVQNWTKREAQRMARHHRGTSHLAGVPHFVERYVVFHPRYLKYVTGPGRKLYPEWTTRPDGTPRDRTTILFSFNDGWTPVEHRDDVFVYESKTPIRYRA